MYYNALKCQLCVFSATDLCTLKPDRKAETQTQQPGSYMTMALVRVVSC